ncbi:MAG: YidC/Oxa1 family membrane protein insertase [Clostridiales bacterium]|nr:YidC/Oxa1 family membrane protein insertase [Clostridiales bacterium]
MFSLFLTQGGGLLGPIEKVFGEILNLIYIFLSKFGIENVGLTIIFFTMIVKTLMLPLTIRQQRFSKLSSVMNPEIVAIQNKYKDKKDSESMQMQQMELKAVYEKYGTSQTAGCLSTLISLPIMLGLYRVVYKIPAYIKPIKEWYKIIAESISPIEGSAAKLIEYGKELGVKVSDFTEFTSEGILTVNHSIDILSKFKAETWEKLASVDFASVADTITNYSSEIIRVNSIPGGLNLLENPGLKFPGLLIPVLAAALQFVQAKQMSITTTNNSDNPTAASMQTMNKVMPIMSGVFCTMLPTGVGLYWIANSFFTIIQQFFINRYMKNADIDKMIEKQKEKYSKKQEEAGLKTGNSLEKIAKASTKSIDTNIYKTQESSSDTDKSSNSDINKGNNSNNTTSSISSYANILKDRYNDKGDK